MIHEYNLKCHVIVPNIARRHQNGPYLLLSILKINISLN